MPKSEPMLGIIDLNRKVVVLTKDNKYNLTDEEVVARIFYALKDRGAIDFKVKDSDFEIKNADHFFYHRGGIKNEDDIRAHYSKKGELMKNSYIPFATLNVATKEMFEIIDEDVDLRYYGAEVISGDEMQWGIFPITKEKDMTIM